MPLCPVLLIARWELSTGSSVVTDFFGLSHKHLQCRSYIQSPEELRAIMEGKDETSCSLLFSLLLQNTPKRQLEREKTYFCSWFQPVTVEKAQQSSWWQELAA